jgi:hypothetical protein
MFTTAPFRPQPVTEEATQWLPYSIEDFSGGLNTAEPSSALRKDQFTVLLNYYHQPNRTLLTRGPFRPWLVASEDTILPNTAPPLSFKIVELRGSDYRVACWDNGGNTEVSVYDESNNRWAGEGGGTSIKADLTDGYISRFVKYSVNEAEDLLFCNGKDAPQRWVGTVDTASTALGLAVPSFEGAEAGTEDNTLGAGDRGITLGGVYTYKFTYFYDDSGTSTKYGESGPSAALTSADLSNATAANPVACSLNIDLSGSAFPSGISKCNVYRSPAGQATGPFEFVGFFTSGDTYTDNRPNGEEGAEPDIDAGTPPRLKNPLEQDGRLWGIGINSSGALTNKGVYSRKGNPDFFPAENFAYFPDPLVGPVAFRKDVYWFTEEQIYVTPEGDVDKYPKPVKVCEIGCDSFTSIVDVGNGLMWQFDGNIYWANFNSFNPTTGDLPWPVGDPIRDKIAAIPVAYRDKSIGKFHKDRYYLSITGPNQTVNTATIVWDVKNGTRMLLQGQTGGWTSLNWSANDLQSFDGGLYSADNTNKYIMEHDFAGSADFINKTEYDASTSYNINTQLATGDIHFGHEWSEKLVNSLSLIAESSGITMETTVSFNDNEFERTKQFILGSGTVAIDSTWLIWGQGTWGNFNWGSSSFGFQSGHKKIAKGGKGRNAKLTLESIDSKDTNLIALKLYHKILPIPA